jgi:Ca2+-binding EF-hand superfamily protein/predicted double-glycine peptidase
MLDSVSSPATMPLPAPKPPEPVPPAPTTTTPAASAPTTPAAAPGTTTPTGTTATEAAPEKPAAPPKPFSWKDDFEALDKNTDGKLGKSELKLPGAKGMDLNKDKSVTLEEFRTAQRKANSFEGLDADKSGTLDAQELAKMRRFDDRAYGDGQTVTKDQFNQTRRAELHDNRTARMTEKFKEGLSKAEAKRMQRFAGEDGKLSAKEYVEGRRTAWREWHNERQDKLFERAGGKGGVLDVTQKAGERYKSYDTDNDGKVSKDEFKKGYKADLQEVWNARVEKGGLTDKGLRQRLNYGTNSFAEKIKMPEKPDAMHDSRNQWWISQYGGSSNPNEDVTGWDNANCGPTSLTMAARAFGKLDLKPGEVDAAIERSRRLMGDAQSERDGTSGTGIARGAEAYGLDADVIPDANVDKIQAELKKGRLPIINGNVIRPDGSYGGGHFYVVTKIENGQAYLADPYSKTGPSVVSTDRLMTSINGHFLGQMISIGDKK